MIERQLQILRMLKKVIQQGRRDDTTGGVASQFRYGLCRTENEAWEKARLGAPGLGG